MRWLEQVLDSAVADLFAQSQVPGLSIAVRFDGGPLVERQFGHAALDPPVPVTDRTSFLALSLSKPVTAMVTLLLVQRGVFALDAPLLAYTPDYRIPAERFGGVDPAALTVRRVLSHASGLNRPRFDWRSDPAPRPAIDLLRATDAGDEPLAITGKPGCGPVYSSGAFLLLQHAIERLTGLGFVHAAERLVLQPLGMRGSTFDTRTALAVADAHADRTARFPRRWATGEASAGLVTTPRDLTRFFAALLPGSATPHPALAPQRAALLTRPAVTDPTVGTCSLGLFLHRTPTDLEYFHAAIKDGWWSWGEGLLHRRVTFAICTNASAGSRLVPAITAIIRPALYEHALAVPRTAPGAFHAAGGTRLQPGSPPR